MKKDKNNKKKKTFLGKYTKRELDARRYEQSKEKVVRLIDMNQELLDLLGKV